MNGPTIALWASNLAKPVGGVDGWIERVETKLVGLAACEPAVDLLVLPEAVSGQWLVDVAVTRTGLRPVSYMTRQVPRVLEHLTAACRACGVALLVGSIPTVAEDGTCRNRAHFISEAGRVRYQDKLFLTPGERESGSDDLAFTPGSRLQLFRWRGLTVAILICLDVEVATLSQNLLARGVELVLVPSRTAAATGYHRVFSCARARAIELQAYVCAVGLVGTVGEINNFSGAAVFGPCEPWGAADGVIARLDPHGERDDAGAVLIAPPLDITGLRRSRAGAAEVWPGVEVTRLIAVKDDPEDISTVVKSTDLGATR